MKTSPSEMRVQGFETFGGPEVLREYRLEIPSPGADDLLVRVSRAGLNPVDAKIRSGAGTSGSTALPSIPDPPMVVGFDACAIVEAVGANVDGFRPGERVWYAGVAGRRGSCAQYQVVDHRIVSRVPANLSDEDAAVFPLASLTAWECLVEQLGADAGSGTVLITGGAGGVGSIAVPLAAKVLGWNVVATASREESRRWCLDRGAHGVVDHSKPLKPQMTVAPDLILHTGPAAAVPELLDLVAPLGKVCLIAGGPELTRLDVTPLIAKRATLTFEMMFARPRLGLEPHRQGRILERIADLVGAGILPSPRANTLPWHDLPEGHRRLESRTTIGKIALEIPEG